MFKLSGKRSFFEHARSVLMLTGIMWGVFIIDVLVPIDFYRHFGLDTTSFSGLIGIVTYPFLHGSLMHLINNTFPLLILSLLLFSTYSNDGWEIIAGITVIGGFATWLCGYLLFPPAIHVGASGIIFGMAGFLMAAGLLTRKIIPILVGVLAFIFYGFPLLFGLIPIMSGVSYSSHWFGFLAGIGMACLYRSSENAKGN